MASPPVSPNWRWPEAPNQPEPAPVRCEFCYDGRAHPTGHWCSERTHGATIAQLRRDRDEMVQVLERALEAVATAVRCVPGYHGTPIEESVEDDLRPARALLARVKR